MTNMGDWQNLRNNLEKTQERIARQKARSAKLSNKTKQRKKSGNYTRGTLLLTEKRKSTLNKIRWWLFLLIVLLIFILAYTT